MTTVTVGILGGGQLARMMVLAGAPMGLRFELFDPAADACGGQLAPLQVAAFEDEAALAAFAERVDVVTFDFENVPARSAQFLADRVPVYPNPDALAVAQDRLSEKTLFRELGIPLPAFADIGSRDELATPGWPSSACRASSSPAASVTTARASSACAVRPTSMRRGMRWADRWPAPA